MWTVHIYTHSATTIVSYSNVQGGGYVGSGNLDVDPLFATPISGTLAPTTTGDYLVAARLTSN